MRLFWSVHVGSGCTLIGTLLGMSAMADSQILESSSLLRDKITVEGIRAHQRAFQDIADKNRGNRAAGSGGYRDSVSYVRDRMMAAGYEVSLQDFPIILSEDQSKPELKILGPEEYDFQVDIDFTSMSLGASAELSAEIEAVDLIIPSPGANSSTSGCEREDFRGFTPGNIALIQRGECTFFDKIENAIEAGAAGVIIFNEGSEGHLEVLATRVRTATPDFPVLGASFDVGNKLRANILNGPTGVQAKLKIDVVNETRQVQNIIAESPGGDASRVIVVGAHLDSVQAGPGINDNGSGSATILEIAEEYAALGLLPQNKLRFMWFGAEELGLLGSEHYVNSLNAAQRAKIIAMLNFDMLASPNYVRFIYDGDGSSMSASSWPGPHGSDYIEKLFLDYFKDQSMITHPTDFDGRSDYGPFIQAGIPAGGLFSGAEGIKSARLAQIYGGTAHAPFDPCYHRSCDNFQNTGETEASSLALKSLSELSLSAAHAVATLSNTADAIRRPRGVIEEMPKPKFEYKGPMLVR